MFIQTEEKMNLRDLVLAKLKVMGFELLGEGENGMLFKRTSTNKIIGVLYDETDWETSWLRRDIHPFLVILENNEIKFKDLLFGDVLVTI